MLSEKLKAARNSKKWTTRKLAKEAKITHAMVTRYESGVVVPTEKVLKKIANALEVTIQDLYASNDPVLSESTFNQKEYELKLGQARNFNVREKLILSGMIDTFLKVQEIQKSLAELNKKANINFS